MTARTRTSVPAAHCGTTLIGGRYSVLQELGRGGNAVVYRVRDARGGPELALKQLVVDPSQPQVDQAIAQFEREYYQLAQLIHPRVISVYDYGVDPTGRFYTMELLEGGDLKQLSPMPVSQACRLMFDICSSLALLHSRRLVHRDVTPRNVRCSLEGHAKLIDFGAMAPMGQCSHIAGTPAFIAPEVVHKLRIDGRADLFSLGATLYYALTDRPPFSVRHFSELQEAYGREPIAPSRLVAGIPPALDALCAALLRFDPAQRPRSAFEVMHRLAAIAGTRGDEPIGVPQAYLTTPLLCARASQLRTFRRCLHDTVGGHGSALMFRSAPGLGRSRMLEACALEAKTRGVTVLRAGAGGAALLAVATKLGEQLLQALPEVALQAAERAKVAPLLFDAHSAEPRMKRLEDVRDREPVRSALSAWVTSICETHSVLLLVDDVQRLEESSQAWIAGLALAAPGLHLQVAATIDTRQVVSSALSVLIKHCVQVDLHALTRTETEMLLVSVFGDVPNVRLLAERVYGLARGNPRDTLLLAQHLVDADLIRYRDGQWTLPMELRSGDLPENASGALRARIVALPPLARRLAHCQALIGMESLGRGAYARLAPGESVAEIDSALLALVGAEILESDGDRYQLSHPVLATVLSEMLSEAERQRHHLAVYELYEGSRNTHPYLLLPHLVGAGRVAEAFEVMSASSQWLDQQGESVIDGIDIHRIGVVFERMLELGALLGRPVRDAYELRRRLCVLSVVSDDALHTRVSPAWLAQLCKDSGLSDYWDAQQQAADAAQLGSALAAARARYASAPAHERVYRVDEAIKHLAVYVVTSIVISVRTNDTRLMHSLPPLIEPFATLSPALHAIWQNVVALNESEVYGRRVSAAHRQREVYERLKQLDERNVPYRQSICGALASSLGWFEAWLGRPEAFDWATRLDEDPLESVGAMEIRCAAALMQGDMERVEIYEQEAELRALTAHRRPMFGQWKGIALDAAVLTHDLARLKRLVDEIAPLAARYPNWRPFVDTAEGYFSLLRGDPASALAAFGRSLELCEAPQTALPAYVAVWTHACAGTTTALCELGREREAFEFGERALARSAAIGLEVSGHRIARAVALAECAVSGPAAAAQRIEQLLDVETQQDVRGLHRAATYETRARIALRAGDAVTARHYALLILPVDAATSATAARQIARVLGEARKMGIDLELGATASAVLGLDTGRPRHDRSSLGPTRAYLRDCSTPSERADRALELLCELAEAPSGHLYLADANARLRLSASRGEAPSNLAELMFVQGFFEQQRDDAQITELISLGTYSGSTPSVAAYYDDSGTQQHLIVLSCTPHGEPVFVGVAAVAATSEKRLSSEAIPRASALAAELLAAADSPGIR